MILYLFLSYMIIVGMMLETYEDRSIPREAWFLFILSPIVLPIVIGMWLIQHGEKDEK